MQSITARRMIPGLVLKQQKGLCLGMLQNQMPAPATSSWFLLTVPLAALLGPDAPGLSATTITRLKADWWDAYERWSKRGLSTRRYVYFAARSFGSGRMASTSRLGWSLSVAKSIRGIDFSENDR